MRKWFDTHCHLDLLPANADLNKVMENAGKVGVCRIIVPGVSGAVKNAGMLQAFAGVECAWGFHPDKSCSQELMLRATPWASCGYQPVAIGECGLDKRSEKPLIEQLAMFEWQMHLAIKHNLPLIVHLVGHYQVAYDLLSNVSIPAGVVLHSWSGSVEMALRFVGLGTFLSLSASTLKNPDKLRKLVVAVGFNHLLIETDSPDMKPEFWHGSFNEPAVLVEIGARIAAAGEIEVAKLAEILYTNSTRIFAKA